MSTWAERMTSKADLEDLTSKAAAVGLGSDKPGETTGEQDRPHNLGFQHGEIKPQNL